MTTPLIITDQNPKQVSTLYTPNVNLTTAQGGRYEAHETDKGTEGGAFHPNLPKMTQLLSVKTET